jgi:hypothetical protein
MSRVSSRLVLGEAGTVVVQSASTNTGNFDAITALSQGTGTLTISGTSYGTVAFYHGSTIHGDITSFIYQSGGPFALYKDLP